MYVNTSYVYLINQRRMNEFSELEFFAIFSHNNDLLFRWSKKKKKWLSVSLCTSCTISQLNENKNSNYIQSGIRWTFSIYIREKCRVIQKRTNPLFLALFKNSMYLTTGGENNNNSDAMIIVTSVPDKGKAKTVCARVNGNWKKNMYSRNCFCAHSSCKHCTRILYLFFRVLLEEWQVSFRKIINN